ncbi:hypothetical protein A0H81_07799 [Grifola frondosa]|uniref:Uncharacterized protein n=1 Tax=Grifola frondosa TaxID=5627 RepID=A0A1C7M772_GRIFR|nr:hypothetical protein A0H81_07799 [Grifola frondosa]
MNIGPERVGQIKPSFGEEAWLQEVPKSLSLDGRVGRRYSTFSVVARMSGRHQPDSATTLGMGMRHLRHTHRYPGTYVQATLGRGSCQYPIVLYDVLSHMVI